MALTQVAAVYSQWLELFCNFQGSGHEPSLCNGWEQKGRLLCTWTETLEKHHAVEIWTFCTLLRSLWTVPNFKSGQLWLARGKTAQMNSAILFFHYFYFPDCCTKFTLVLGRFSYFALWGPIVLCEIGTSIQLLSHKNTCRFEDTVHLSQFLVIHTETHLTDDMMTLKVVFVV